MNTVQDLFQKICDLTRNDKSGLPEGMSLLDVYFENKFHKDFLCEYSMMFTYRGKPNWNFGILCCWYVHRLHKLELVTDFEKHETKLYDIGKELTPEQTREITEIVTKNLDYLKKRYNMVDTDTEKMTSELAWGLKYKGKISYWNKCYWADLKV